MTDCVLIGGVFDPLHAGHLAYLREAAKFGPLLGVLSDAPHKHPPLVPIADRAKLLKWLGVDLVVIGQTVAEVLKAEQPRAYIKGADWRGKLPAEELDVCIKQGIEIIYLETVTQSSSQLLAQYERARNTERLAAFEAFVQGQKPASTPWEPVTDYSLEARTAIEGQHAQLIRESFGTSIMLDVGCGPGHLVSMLKAVGVRAIGMDSSPTATAAIYDDITGEFPDAMRGIYNTVICREVLEHLTVRQIAVAVRNLVKLSSRFIYVTTRFVDGVSNAQNHLLDCAGGDDLDPTHITLLNQSLLRTLFVLEGCTRRADLEAALDWRNLGRVLVYQVPA